MKNSLERLVWAEIRLADYTYNLSQIKKLVGSRVKLMAVVKANAYGHGIIDMGKAAGKFGADYLGVVCLHEGRLLREAGVKTPILILNYIDPLGVRKALDLGLTVNVMDEEVLKSLNTYARKTGKKARIHVKIDSGMHRAGLMPDDAVRFIPLIENYKNISLEGIFTHFATSDEKDLGFTKEQLGRFTMLLKSLRSPRLLRELIIHAANSGATLRLKESYFNMVRPGVISYGLAPSLDFKIPFVRKPILILKTNIVQVRRIGKGETVGYGRKYTAEKETVVGLLPVGYGDGYRRGPNNSGIVLVNGKEVEILGRVSMDQTSIDLTGNRNVKVADEVILISNDPQSSICAEKVAERWGTINYEVTTSLAGRVSRVYIK